MELKLFQHTHNLHSSISLFQQGQTMLEKKRKEKLSQSV